MKRSILLGFVLLLQFAVLGMAPPKPAPKEKEPPSEQVIAEWVRQLGDDHFAVREAAQRALIEAGPPVLAAVRKAAQSNEPEVRRRAAEVAKGILTVTVPVADIHKQFPLFRRTFRDHADFLQQQPGVAVSPACLQYVLWWKPGVAALPCLKGRKDPAAWLRDNLEAEVSGDGATLAVRWKGPAILEALIIVRAVAEVYTEDNQDARYSKRAKRIETLEEAIKLTEYRIAEAAPNLPDELQKEREFIKGVRERAGAIRQGADPPPLPFEDRSAAPERPPAVFCWRGPVGDAVSGDWNVGSNWENALGKRYPDAVFPKAAVGGAAQRTVVFDDLSATTCIVGEGSSSCNSITTTATWDGRLRILGTLTVEWGNSQIDTRGGNYPLYVGQNGRLAFYGGTVNWTGGDINGTSPVGAIYLSRGCVFRIVQGMGGSDRLLAGASFNIGYDVDGTPSYAAVEMGGPAPADDMKDILFLQAHVKIWISQGTGPAGQRSRLSLLDNTDVTTTGKISKAGSSKSVIYNRGVIERRNDTLSAAPASIDVPTWNFPEGTVRVVEGNKLKFSGSATAQGVTYSLWSDGTVEVRHNADLHSKNTLYVTGGILHIGEDTVNPGNGKVGRIRGNTRMLDGILLANGLIDPLNDPYIGTAEFYGDLYFGGNATFRADIDVNGGTYDKVVEKSAAPATIRINNIEPLLDDRASIEVYMANNNPPANQKYDLFESPQNILLGIGPRVTGYDAQFATFGKWFFGLDNNATPKVGSVWLPGGAGGKVGNRLWNDADGDGIQDAGEAGAASVVVNLYDGQGNCLVANTTDPAGDYLFSDLAAGSYYPRLACGPGPNPGADGRFTDYWLRVFVA